MEPTQTQASYHICVILDPLLNDTFIHTTKHRTAIDRRMWRWADRTQSLSHYDASHDSATNRARFPLKYHKCTHLNEKDIWDCARKTEIRNVTVKAERNDWSEMVRKYYIKSSVVTNLTDNNIKMKTTRRRTPLWATHVRNTLTYANFCDRGEKYTRSAAADFDSYELLMCII